MIRRTVGLALIAGVAFASGASCTNDFSAFEGTPSAAGRSGSSSNGGSTVDSGADGTSQGGSGGSGGASGSGGGGATAGSGGSLGGTGGQATDAGDAGGAPGTGGGAATGGAAGDSGTAGAGGGCSSSQKLCSGKCVSLDDPATGCSGASCTACSFPNATSICSVGACAQGTCSPGFGDCDTTAAAPGCERPIHDDLANCGGCNRACSSTNVATAACTGNACTSFCKAGFGNCSRPTAGVDNGCETSVTTTANCGGCGNNCGSQRNKSCLAGKCVCDNQRDCFPSNNPPSTVVCDPSGVCKCDTSLCVSGETCASNGTACSCNGDAACGAGQTCCQTPAGCFDLQTDSANCGGCGHPCAPGVACVAGVCQ